MSDDNIIKDVKFPEKKPSDRPADPVIVGEQPAPANPADERLVIEPFEDGSVFKYTPHSKAKGQWVLFNKANMPVGVISSAPIADLICRAVQMLFAAAAVAQAEADLQKRADDLKKTEPVMEA